MKQRTIIAALTLLIATGLQAQNKQPHQERSAQERAKAHTERMSKDLGLNAEQTTRVEAINLKYAEQAEVLRKEREAERKEKDGRGKEVRDARDAELKAVLNSEQYEKMLAQREKMKEQRAQERKDAHDAPRK